jgi:hypothetical protein
MNVAEIGRVTIPGGERRISSLLAAFISLYGTRTRTEKEFEQKQAGIDRCDGSPTEGIHRILMKVSEQKPFFNYNIEDPSVRQGRSFRKRARPRSAIENQSFIPNMCKHSVMIRKHSSKDPKLSHYRFATDPR